MQQVELFRAGSYEFFITGIIEKDRDGNSLKMRDGQPYKRLRLAIVSKDGNIRNLYDPIFGVDSEKVRQLINCVGTEELKQRFYSGNFRVEDLVGTGGSCLIGIRSATDKYAAQNSVECYLQRGYGKLEHNPGEADKWKAESNNKQGFVSSDNLEPVIDDMDVPF